MKNKTTILKAFLKDRFNLNHDHDDVQLTINGIEKGIEFKGINLWTLIFAIFVASIGLNVNSTAVIIGAMLISPLMGPIMGLGLSVGIYDFEMLKKSLKNLSIAVAISVLTSTIYFFVSPLNEAKSELLARTTPTIYDVLIALFGGLAGIVASTTKEKGHVLPGVAIATALMPPLCTAGFGLATGNLFYFMGASYLFFINAVMISVSVFIMVRFFKFPHKQQVNKAQSDKVKRYISIVVFVTVMPSILFANRIVRQAIFETNAKQFVKTEFNPDKTYILDYTYTYHTTDSSEIDLVLGGEPLEDEQLMIIRKKLADYKLKYTKLNIKQGLNNRNQSASKLFNPDLFEDIYRKKEFELISKDKEIQTLKSTIEKSRPTVSASILGNEIAAINPKVIKISIGKSEIYEVTETSNDTVILILL